MKLLITQFLQPPIISPLFGPNILLRTLFSSIFRLSTYTLIQLVVKFQ
jgi:hypothetical protein